MSNVPQSWEILNSEDGGEVIDSRAIAQRLDDLNSEHVDSEGDTLPVREWPTEAREEFDALTELLDDIASNLPNGWDLSADGDSLTIVRDTFLAEYVKSWYGDTYGGDLHTRDRYGSEVRLSWDDVMDREPFCWINWDDVAAEWRRRCSEITYHGATYYLDF